MMVAYREQTLKKKQCKRKENIGNYGQEALVNEAQQKYIYARDNPVFKENWCILMRRRPFTELSNAQGDLLFFGGFKLFCDPDPCQCIIRSQSALGNVIASGMYSGKFVPMFHAGWSILHLIFLGVTMWHSLTVDYDLGLFSASCDYALMVASACASILNCRYYSSCMDKMIRYIEKDFADYDDTLDPDTLQEVEEERRLMKKEKERVARFYFSLFVFSACTTMIIFPLAFPDPNRAKNDIINRNLPVSLYYPFKTDTWLKWAPCVLAEWLVAGTIIFVVSGTDIPFSCFTQEGVFQLKKLGLTFKNSQRRAKYLYLKRYDKEMEDFQDPQYIGCLKDCLNKSVRHHYIIVKFFREAGAHYFHILLIIMIGSTFLLCMSGILFVNEQVEIGPKLQSLIYLIAVLMHTFTFTWLGEMISDTCWLVRQQIYEAEWQSSSRELKAYMLMVMAYLNKPITLKVGGFMISNLNTFGSVLSSSYSYFSLLSVTMARGEQQLQGTHKI